MASGGDQRHGRVPFARLKMAGFSEDELLTSRRKLHALVRELDPGAQLSQEVQEALLELSTRFVEAAANFGCKLAQHRGADHLQLDDLRLYVEDVFGVHVPGFGATATGNLPASFYVDAIQRGTPGRVPDQHAARLALKRNAHHVVLKDDFALALSAGNAPGMNAAKRSKLP
mmetsp:Transcript_23151/g.65727  ORF Transcript_23151/g.65727 Transcript_23151/m.65727 type:complete len:172 (-) Transcript_23151:512-1027(-)